MTRDGIRVEADGAVLTITIDRSHVRNALDPLAHTALAQAFDQLEADAALRVGILTGAGSRAFCAGTDLKARADAGADQHPPTGFGGITKRFNRSKPVIAAVNGAAIGGGVEMILACDLAIACESACFSLPEPRVGLAASGGAGIQRLLRTLPTKHAMALLLTSQAIDAFKAERIGLVNAVVANDALQPTARAWTEAIIGGAPLAIRAAMRVAYQSLDHPSLAAAVGARYAELEEMLSSEDAIEGPRAFVEKRKPVWKGR